MRTCKRKPRLQIIRGLPGSGKSTLAINRYPHLLRLETDFYFYHCGAYRFTMPRNEKAVDWFTTSIINICAYEKFDFVVTGVFTAHTERLNTVVETALTLGYEVWIKTLTADFGNTHGVNPKHLQSMKDNFVPDRELRKRFPEVHFGLMPKGNGLAR